MHRGGPDDAGLFLHPNLPLALGHRRLSILDLTSAGHQPMSVAEGRLQIVYNGEIYNFREIRSELESMGYRFRTQTDTEVILTGYLEWGTDCFSRFNGMFAMAIWDNQKSELVLARDHAGIKPLYYTIDQGRLFFASEVRAFTALYPNWEPETIWKPLFLVFGHLPEPFTTLKGVKTLGKGEWVRVSLPSLAVSSGNFSIENYEVTVTDFNNALELVRDILPQAVKRHLVSDAPIGLFLSGGIDSSLLTLLSAPILRNYLQTLSIQFEEAEYNEQVYQEMVINISNAKHSAFNVSQKDFDTALPDILAAMDQPSIDAINTYFISMYARRIGLKAVLSGLGADELFGGYPSFNRFKTWQYLRYVPGFISKRAGLLESNRLSRLSFERFHPMLSLYLMNRALYTVEKAAAATGCAVREIELALEKIALPKGLDYSRLNSNAAMEINLYMKNQLLKDADYMGMWHGLEIRVPFLDKELMTAVNSISPGIKFRSDIPKSLLIESFATLLPAEIWHRKKQGFTFPFAYWLKRSDQLKPIGKQEQSVFSGFQQDRVHWSRYWALKIAGMEKFN